jgi:hypothetical protein
VDQVDNSLQASRLSLVGDVLTYRNLLDQFKVQMGIPPDVPLVLDTSILQGFVDPYDEFDAWRARPDRDVSEIPTFIEHLPKLQEVIIDGRPVIRPLEQGRTKKSISISEEQDAELNDLLLAAERVAFENRLDLMNQRAALYDAWRQLRFTANGLLGVFNVAITNQIYTPPTTTNPFAFLSEAKQFSLVLNAELPLVRVAQRNTYRQAWINYQRTRRTLMQLEDQIKFQVRQEIRSLRATYQQYEVGKYRLVLLFRQLDQSQEQLIAPPQPGAAVQSAATQTINLTNFLSTVLTQQVLLLTQWYSYQQTRLLLYRDLGLMPIDEWEALYELFPPNTPATGAGTGRRRRPAPRA